MTDENKQGPSKAQVIASLRRTQERSAASRAAARKTQEVAAACERQADDVSFRSTRRLGGVGSAGAAPPPLPPGTGQASAPVAERPEMARPPRAQAKQCTCQTEGECEHVEGRRP